MKVLHDFKRNGSISGRKMFFYTFFSILAAAYFMYLVYSIHDNKSELSQIQPQLEDYVLSQQFLNSYACFAYQDQDSKRIMPWSIDIGKFNEESLSRCYPVKDTKTKAYRFTLIYGSKKVTINTGNWEGFLSKADTKKVSVFENGRLIEDSAELFIEIQNAK
jgi:hypothetical protein